MKEIENNMYRICMISDSQDAFDDRIYWKQAVSLRKAGYQVTHIVIAKEESEFYTKENIKIVKIKSVIYFKNRLLNLFFKIIFRNSNLNLLFKAAKNEKADVYHFHDLKINFIVRKLKKLPWNPKIIYDVHEPFPEDFFYRNSFPFIKGIFRKSVAEIIRNWELKKSKMCDYIIATEKNVADKFLSELKKNNVGIIYNYTDLIEIKEIEKSEYDVIYCGGISEIRGVMNILSAINSLRNENVSVKTIFIGPISNSILKKKISDFIVNNQLSDLVEFKDPVPYTEVKEFYRKSKIGMIVFDDLPLHRIIMPIKTFEYMGMGIPTICHNFGHSEKIIRENNAGIIVNPQSIKEIKQAIKQLIKDEEFYKKLSINANKTAEKKYNWSLMEQELYSIYRNVIQQ